MAIPHRRARGPQRIRFPNLRRIDKCRIVDGIINGAAVLEKVGLFSVVAVGLACPGGEGDLVGKEITIVKGILRDYAVLQWLEATPAGNGRRG